MKKFITVTDVTFLANYEPKTIFSPEKIIINTDNISKISTEKDTYFFEDKVCTVIRVMENKWGFVVTETMEEILNLINQ